MKCAAENLRFSLATWMANSELIVAPSLNIRGELEKRGERRRRRIAESLVIAALVERGRAQEALALPLGRATEVARELSRPRRIRIEARHQISDRNSMYPS